MGLPDNSMCNPKVIAPNASLVGRMPIQVSTLLGCTSCAKKHRSYVLQDDAVLLVNPGKPHERFATNRNVFHDLAPNADDGPTHPKLDA